MSELLLGISAGVKPAGHGNDNTAQGLIEPPPSGGTLRPPSANPGALMAILRDTYSPTYNGVPDRLGFHAAGGVRRYWIRAISCECKSFAESEYLPPGGPM